MVQALAGIRGVHALERQQALVGNGTFHSGDRERYLLIVDQRIIVRTKLLAQLLNQTLREQVNHAHAHDGLVIRLAGIDKLRGTPVVFTTDARWRGTLRTRSRAPETAAGYTALRCNQSVGALRHGQGLGAERRRMCYTSERCSEWIVGLHSPRPHYPASSACMACTGQMQPLIPLMVQGRSASQTLVRHEPHRFGTWGKTRTCGESGIGAVRTSPHPTLGLVVRVQWQLGQQLFGAVQADHGAASASFSASGMRSWPERSLGRSKSLTSDSALFIASC